jgi:hypothetical protein
VSGKWCYLYRAVDKEGKTIAGIELHRMLKKVPLENVGEMPAWQQFYEIAA